MRIPVVNSLSTLRPTGDLRGPLFVTFLSFILGKKFLNENDVELDFSIDYALLLFSLFMNNKQKMYVPNPD